MKQLIALLSLTVAPVYAAYAAPVIDDILLQKVEVPAQPAAPDDYFIALARAADVNFIADATQPFQPVDEADKPSKNTLLSSMVTFAQQQRRSQLRFGARTFLFWPEPDVVALAQPIANGKGVQLPAEVPSARQVGIALAEYLRRERGWDGNPEAGIRLHLSDLPLELRQQVQSYAINKLLDLDTQLWLTDAYWEEARLWLGRGTGQKTEQLMVIGVADKDSHRLTSRYISWPPLPKQ